MQTLRRDDAGQAALDRRRDGDDGRRVVEYGGRRLGHCAGRRQVNVHVDTVHGDHVGHPERGREMAGGAAVRQGLVGVHEVEVFGSPRCPVAPQGSVDQLAGVLEQQPLRQQRDAGVFDLHPVDDSVARPLSQAPQSGVEMPQHARRVVCRGDHPDIDARVAQSPNLVVDEAHASAGRRRIEVGDDEHFHRGSPARAAWAGRGASASACARRATAKARPKRIHMGVKLTTVLGPRLPTT